MRETRQHHHDDRHKPDLVISEWANLFAILCHDDASKTVAREFVDSVLNARWAILSLR